MSGPLSQCCAGNSGLMRERLKVTGGIRYLHRHSARHKLLFLLAGLLLCLPFIPSLVQFGPLSGQQFVDVAAFEFTQASTGENDNIKIPQIVLIQTKGFPNMAFYPVTTGGETDIFLGDHQTQPGMIKIILSSQYQQMPVADLDIRMVENLLEISC